VHRYVKDILQNTPSSLEQVTIEPNGRWRLSNNDGNSRQSNGASVHAADDDDDDDLEISEVNVIGGRRLETPKTAATSMSTPASGAGSATPSGGPRGMGSTSQKRPAPAVIDLTLSSDDDDDEPIQRPAKRQNTNSNGFHLPSTTPFYQ
jgi:E3 SUMO-protein ligase PIAS1